MSSIAYYAGIAVSSTLSSPSPSATFFAMKKVAGILGTFLQVSLIFYEP